MKNTKSVIAFSLLLFINLIFSIKYLSRATPFYLPFSIIITAFYYCLWRYKHLAKHFNGKLKLVNLSLVLLFLISISFIFTKISYENLNVDRWSVITSFWDNVFDNKYAYFAKSHMGNPPGPMPFYFILALPFYFIGELGYFSLLGIVVFWMILKYTSKSNLTQTYALLFLMSSIFYLWEIICRSNLFLNGSLILFSMIYLFKSIKNKQPGLIIWNGIFIGLLLSTRNVFVIPYIITFLFLLKHQYLSIKQTFQIGIISVMTFSLTFLPFIYDHLNEFTEMNPFVIQSGFLMPIGYSLFCIILSFSCIFILKEKNDSFFYTGLMLFFTIILHYAYQIKKHNFNEAFFNSRADISYFILCTPFLLYYVLDEERNKFTD